MKTGLLETIALFNAVTAIVGGLGLMFELIQLPLSWLDHTPFHSYVIPGLILAVLTGGSALLSYIGLLDRSRYANVMAYIAGLIMCVWILAGIALTRTANWPQYIYFVLGAMMMAGSYNEAKRLIVGGGPNFGRG